jgi:hypothetical protein
LNFQNSNLFINNGELTTYVFSNWHSAFENYGVVRNTFYFSNQFASFKNYGIIINEKDTELNNENGSFYNINDGKIEGEGKFYGNDPIEQTIKSVSVCARVTKLTGSKNLLTITVAETSHDGKVNVTDYDFMIENNAAGTYKAGAYNVYVNTKGNVQIRDCYLV